VILHVGSHALSQDNADVLDMTNFSKYIKEGYIFLFEIELTMHEKVDSVQQIFLFSDNQIVSDSISNNLSASDAKNKYGKLLASDAWFGGTACDSVPDVWNLSFALNAEDARSTLYLRYDGYFNSVKASELWVRHNVVVKVTVLCAN
jgi:hypothetical protein